MDIKRWIILLSIFTFCFALHQAAEAKEIDSTEVNFNQATLAHGFTVKSADKQLWIPIFPGQFHGDLSLRISGEADPAALPDDWQAISGYYRYEVETGREGFLAKPILLSFSYQSDNDEDKAIYFYDSFQEKWRALPSSVDKEKKLIRTKTIFPGVVVVVLERRPMNQPLARFDSRIEARRAAASSMEEENLTAASAIVIEKESGDIIFRKNIDETRPVASLTKLVSCLVFLDHNPGWNQIITMEKSDFVGGATLWVKEGDQISVKDLFYATLVGSKNNTTRALARATGLSIDDFVSLMNEKVKSFDLAKTHFVEPTGLSENNISTAYEMAVIAKKAFNNLDILKATTTPSYKVTPKNKAVTYSVKNTSEKVLNSGLYITGSKTGWTDEAGYNLVTQAKNKAKELIVLVMGAKIRMNYEEVYQLLKKYL